MPDGVLQSADGWMLRVFLAIRPALEPVLRLLLRRRIAIGKEDASRAQEKLGVPTEDRPDGRLAWFHAVGLGEVLALRPLIMAMQEIDPELNILVTSTAKSSAGVFGANLPPRTRHQYLPLDGPHFSNAFLDHWRPDLSVWSEQDLWPGIVCDTAARGIPLAYVNVRMNAKSYAKRVRAAALYKDVLKRFSLLSAQDPVSAKNLEALSGRRVDRICYLKPAATPLTASEEALATFFSLPKSRSVWVAASTHEADEPVVIEAHKLLVQQSSNAFLILAPRQIERASRIAEALEAAGLSFVRRSSGDLPDDNTQVLLADTYGELGVWYRVASAAFVGGSMGTVGGHNPWEAICLGVPVIAGPNTANFERDYDDLGEKGLFQRVEVDQGAAIALAEAVRKVRDTDMSKRAFALVDAARQELQPVASDLISLVKDSHDS